MHQINIIVQGGENASLSQVLAAIDLAKARLSAGMTQGTGRDGNVGFVFEAREVDADNAVHRLLACHDRDHYLVASADETRRGNRT
jgi:hypothetical protein